MEHRQLHLHGCWSSVRLSMAGGERTAMPLPPRLFPGDVELGKRDDDHRPGSKSSLSMAWQQHQLLHSPHRRTMKRLALAIIALVVLYYFFKNMPTDLKSPRTRPHYDHSGGQQSPIGSSKTPPPRDQDPTSDSERERTADQSLHHYSGPIKFYELAASLHGVVKNKGPPSTNKNVVCVCSCWS